MKKTINFIIIPLQIRDVCHFAPESLKKGGANLLFPYCRSLFNRAQKRFLLGNFLLYSLAVRAILGFRANLGKAADPDIVSLALL